MKRISLLVLILASLVLIGASCQKINEPPEIEGTDQGATTREIREVVDNYLKLTLGTIPGAAVDYETAKDYLTPELAAQFDSPMFIPQSYCIQDGPSDVRIKSVKFLNDEATAEVEAQYGSGWLKMWEFSLVKQSADWKIEAIKCLQM